MRVVQKDVSASLFKEQPAKEKTRASNSLPRSIRLSDSDLIRQVLAQKPQVSKYIAKHSFKHTKLGIALTVPKKLAKRAVDRNRIKRLMREVYRQTKAEDSLPELTVIRLRKKIGDKTKNKLRESERIEIRSELSRLIK
jgi:ribonuclease P protein component